MGAPQWAKRQGGGGGNGGKRPHSGGNSSSSGGGNGGASNNSASSKDQQQPQRRSRPSKTNRAQEAKRFSTITMPRRAEVKTANERGLAPDMRARPPAQYVAQMQEKQRVANAAAVAAVAARQSQTGKTSLPFDPSPAAATRGFDPIPNDGMFDMVPPEASHWPPPSLAEIFGSEDAARAAENLDQYDRTAEDSAAAAAAEEVAAAAKKVAAKRVAGELRHPRGKAPVNAKVKLDNSDSD